MFDNKIIFKEDTHQYFNKLDNTEYIPVSLFLKHFYEPFDADKISYFVAKKRGVSKQTILDEWAENRDFSCERGTAFHLAMENAIKFGEIDTNYKKVIENFQLVVQRLFNDIKNIYSEQLLYIDEYKIAGTSDIIFEHNDGTFTIGDFKTNKKFNFHSLYKKWMKYPVSHLSECEFVKYTLQLSLYAYMYEQLTKKKCRGIVLFWLNPSTGKWETINSIYLKCDIIMMLRHYAKIKSANNI